ncbi:hypothetical protein BD626DRAFT_506928, partial [Schizophyllum amplum]
LALPAAVTVVLTTTLAFATFGMTLNIGVTGEIKQEQRRGQDLLFNLAIVRVNGRMRWVDCSTNICVEGTPRSSYKMR